MVAWFVLNDSTNSGTLECASGNGFPPVSGNNDLTAGGMAPFLMTAFLADQHETVPAQYPDHVLDSADWKALAHGSATSSTLAPAGIGCGDGSNQSSRASLALATASSSVSPAATSTAM